MSEKTPGPRTRAGGDAREILDRTRRIETRLTKYLESIGFETHAQKPEWDYDGETSEGRVTVPSLHTSLKDILATVPPNYLNENDVIIVHAGQVVAALTLP